MLRMRPIAVMLVLLHFVAPARPAPAAPTPTKPTDVLLRDVAEQAGIQVRVVCGSHKAKRFIVEQLGGGGALFDYDNDDDLDLFVGNGTDLEHFNAPNPPPSHRSVLYRNDSHHDSDDGWHFVDVTVQAGVGNDGWGVGAIAADPDGDGDNDLYLTRFGTNVFYENLGDGTFRDISAASGTADPGYGASAAFIDYDTDGDLDLYLTNYVILDLDDPPQGGRPCAYEGLPTACGPVGFPKPRDRLFRNDGDLRFSDVSETAGIWSVEPEYSLGVVAGDYDDDGRPDLFVGNDSGPNFLFRNLGGRFTDEALLSGVATQAEGRTQAAMGVALDDVDGDGLPDIFVTNFSLDHNTLYRNMGDGFFRDQSYPSGLGGPSLQPMGWGTRFADLDNDGDLDALVANGHIYPEVDAQGRESFRQVNQIFLNDGQGKMTETPNVLAPRADGPQVSRGLSVGDLDLDGDPDVVIFEMGTRPTLLMNDDGASLGNALDLQLISSHGLREGARVWVTANGKKQRREATSSGSFCSSSEPWLHTGLGPAQEAEVEIHWQGGHRQRIAPLPANRRYQLREIP